MRKPLSVTAACIALVCGAAQAQTSPLKMTPGQDKVAALSACEKAAGARKGEERKTFLLSCVAARNEPQQSKVANAPTHSFSNCHHGDASDL